MSGYLAADFEFSNVSWNTQLLVNRRESEYKGFRQFFPVIAAARARLTCKATIRTS